MLGEAPAGPDLAAGLHRPVQVVVVGGTGTGVGKTWVAASLAAGLRRRGRTVAARKPAQSFEPGTGPTDAEVLAAATGERPELVCPEARSYSVPMTPFMAADVLGRPPFTVAGLAAEIRWPLGVEVGLVEGVGGIRSPIDADGGDTVTLVELLGADAVVLVADAGLGTINAVRLCLAALAGRRVVVVLNRFDAADELHARNAAWLTRHAATPVVTDVAALADELLG